MSVASDIQLYLRNAGAVNETTVRSVIGLESRDRGGFNGPTVMIEPLTGQQNDTHGDENRGPGFRIAVRTAQHKYADCENLFYQIRDLLQNQHDAINATPGVSHTYYLVRTDQDGPLTMADAMDRPIMTGVFRCLIAK